ncbi:MAG: hypothetical protein V4525_08815 [Pseudomonadota bacterium]
MLEIKVKRLHADAILTKNRSQGIGIIELCAITNGRIDPPGLVEVSTGLALELPEGYTMFIVANSKNGPKYGVGIANGFNIITSDYHDEIKVVLNSSYPFKFFKGDKLAHGIVLPTAMMTFVEMDTPSFPELFPHQPFPLVEITTRKGFNM